MHLTIVAAGSRGDVQPYIALALGLVSTGYEVQFCADPLFEQLVNSSGLHYTPVTAAPVNFMQQNLSRMGGPLKLTSWLERHFKPLAHQFFTDLETATRHTDAILYSTLAFAGYHVAERQGIPSQAMYNVPISPTHEFQSPSFPAPPRWFPLKRTYNWWSFRFSNQVFINLIRPVVNECRRDVLGLKPVDAAFYRRLDVTPLPVIYGFSPAILPRPNDWGEWLQVSGHWFLDTAPNWQAPEKLLEFLDGGKPPIYVGFGSMVDQQIETATRIVLGALERSGERAILLGGWGGLGTGYLPDNVLRLDSVPHDWLFRRVSAVVHHGGSGTTATGLRYGRPTVIVPFFADLPFWGERVFRLEAGPRPIPFSKLSIPKLAEAIDRAVNDPVYRQNAEAIAQKMNNEEGVRKAVSLVQAALQAKILSSIS